MPVREAEVRRAPRHPLLVGARVGVEAKAPALLDAVAESATVVVQTTILRAARIVVEEEADGVRAPLVLVDAVPVSRPDDEQVGREAPAAARPHPAVQMRVVSVVDLRLAHHDAALLADDARRIGEDEAAAPRVAMVVDEFLREQESALLHAHRDVRRVRGDNRERAVAALHKRARAVPRVEAETRRRVGGRLLRRRLEPQVGDDVLRPAAAHVAVEAQITLRRAAEHGG